MIDTLTTPQEVATGSKPRELIRAVGLTRHFNSRAGGRRGIVHALDDVSLTVHEGETVALVGESGSGKSTFGQTILQLTRPTAGQVFHDGVDLTTLSDAQMRPLRRRLQIVFQDPLSSLNPRMTIGDAIAQPIRHHKRTPAAEVARRVDRILEDVGLSAAFADRYPHELSGGQCQRAAIGRALACEPDFIICDEVLSALDVSVQAQIINLLMNLQQRYRLGYLFISHDLSVVRHMASRVAVLYLGKMVELAPRAGLFASPLHPYTRALLAVAPGLGDMEEPRLAGEIPSPLAPPAGCRFHTRCPIATDRCRAELPAWRELRPDHFVACHLAGGAANLEEQAS
jgi:peptide/nickel transport system ATP-binding protein